MNLDHLGAPLRPMTRVQGKASNCMYRLDTGRGSFAVKQLNVVRDWTFHHDDVFRLEQAAFAAGIPMPEPICADAEVLVHRWWVEGHQLPEEAVSRAFALEIGEILARIHTLDVTWTHGSVEEPTPQDWPALAERAAATGQPWADELANSVDVLLAIAHFVDTCERPGPVVLTHRGHLPVESARSRRPAGRARLGDLREARAGQRAWLNRAEPFERARLRRH
jgi:hypothetical protein